MSISVITSRFVRLVYKLNFFSLIIPREHLKSGMMAVANFFTNIEAKSFVSGFSSRSEVMSRFLQNSKTSLLRSSGNSFKNSGSSMDMDIGDAVPIGAMIRLVEGFGES